MRNPITAVTKFIANIGTKRSPHWPAVRAKHIRREGWCRKCGGVKNLEAHHIEPFHLHPELELDDGTDGTGMDGNLITLCERIGRECHLKAGHLGNWKNFNPAIRQQATAPAPTRHQAQNQNPK